MFAIPYKVMIGKNYLIYILVYCLEVDDKFLEKV